MPARLVTILGTKTKRICCKIHRLSLRWSVCVGFQTVSLLPFSARCDPLMSCDSRLNEGTAESKTQSLRLNESIVH